MCGLPLEHVRETMRPLPLERLPNLPSYVCGLSVIRGRPTPVLDTRVLLGAQTDVPPSRYISLRLGERAAALAVDEVLGVHGVATELLDSPPALAAAQNPHVAALGLLDADLLVLLQHTQLVPEALWLQLEREASDA
jgi:purine-binding chemotaxis protein CheW